MRRSWRWQCSTGLVLTLLLAILRLGILSTVTLAAADAAAQASTVIVVSLDGVRHDYLDTVNRIPALRRIIEEGTRADALVPPFPPLTFPSHVTLATGTYPDRHGIVANHFFDAQRGEVFDYSADASWIDSEPIWVTAERQGVKSATYFWVGSETDWHGRGASYRMRPFDRNVDEATKVDQILAWLDLPEIERPRLIMSWWHGADRAGHETGADTPSVHRALRLQDAQLERLLEGLDARELWDSTTLLVVSDHGMTHAGRGVDVAAKLSSAGIEARVLHGGSIAHVFLQESERDTAAIQRILDALKGIEGVQAHTREALPARYRATHPTRSGDVVVVASPPVVLREGSVLGWLSWRLGWRIGMHGYDPMEHDNMNGIFLAMGRGIHAGAKIGKQHATDVAPTLSHWLGIEAPLSAEGQVIDLSAAAPAEVGGEASP